MDRHLYSRIDPALIDRRGPVLRHHVAPAKPFVQRNDVRRLPLEAIAAEHQAARTAMITSHCHGEQHLASVATRRQVIGYVERRIPRRHRPCAIKGPLALQSLAVLLGQLHSGLLKSEAVADHEARHPTFRREVLFRGVDRFQHIELILIPETQICTSVHQQRRGARIKPGACLKERRPIEFVDLVDVGGVVVKELHDEWIVGLCHGEVQRRPASRLLLSVGICPILQQHLNQAYVSGLCRKVERRLPTDVSRLKVEGPRGADGKQQREDVGACGHCWESLYCGALAQHV
mmetsp:Transcript_9920/g.26211  ORF Transcript_9920/g.26211 Transcript_9920/m.26211 type:complete len:290 (+) Transcript_9920:610-1479(+)